jgi:high-affinity nickel permease
VQAFVFRWPAATAIAYQCRIDPFHNAAGAVETLVSILFLLVIAAMNTVILLMVRRSFRLVKAGDQR